MGTEIEAVAPDAADRFRSAWLLWGGVVLLLGAVLLAVTPASGALNAAVSYSGRAIAAWVTPLGLGLVATGAWGWVTHRAVSRWVLVVLAVVAVSLIALGLWTLTYSLNHQPQTG